VKQLVIPRTGPPEVLRVREAPEPQPGPGQVRVRVRAAGLNFADLMARQGLYPDAPPLPAVMGYEVAGEIDRLGAGVVGHAAGDRVIALTRFGGHSELVVVPASRAVPLPDGWSFAEGAACPVTYLTAHHALVRVAGTRAGETVLVHAAAGGVGLAAVDLCRLIGARVIGLASPTKHLVLRELGVEPLDSRDPRWPDAVRRAAPQGVDVILDSVGAASYRRGYALLAPAGRLVCMGVSALSTGGGRALLHAAWQLARFPRFWTISLMQDNRSVAGVNLGKLWDHEGLLRPQLDALLEHARAGRILPRVDGTFPFSEGASAHTRLHSRHSVGKVVLVP
jgi:NADPH:quinone reductase-like Zn-dependent oxidoreductase